MVFFNCRFSIICTFVCIWRCEGIIFCVEFFVMRHFQNVSSFVHSPFPGQEKRERGDGGRRERRGENVPVGEREGEKD